MSHAARMQILNTREDLFEVTLGPSDFHANVRLCRGSKALGKFYKINWSRLTDSIKQFAAGCIFEENVLDSSLRPLAEIFEYVRMRQYLLDAHFLLHRCLGVGMLLHVDLLHGHSFAGYSVYQQLHPKNHRCINLKCSRNICSHLLSVGAFT